VPFAPSCAELGFDTGRLSCSTTCTFSSESCSGTENCADARDNDGDGETDCSDADCALACADACSAPIAIGAGSFTGTTEGHAPGLDSSCTGSAQSGPRVVYRVDLSAASTLDVSLSSGHALGLRVGQSCSEAESLVCGGRTRLSLDAEAGSYFIAVEAETPDASGEYSLSIQLREPACGDGVRDPAEACDDGNLDDGDGCDPDCGLETSESEPNDSRQLADRFVSGPWFGQLSPAGDVDYYRVQLTASSSTLVVDTFNLGDGACALNLMDSVIEILDTSANANAVLVRDEDSGDGACARAMTGGLPPGNYFVRVSAAGAAQPATFPYRLGIMVGVCGDGQLDLGEVCDDQNLVAGDGCDANCQEEP
jgi:cysteine-rich repeat protein